MKNMLEQQRKLKVTQEKSQEWGRLSGRDKLICNELDFITSGKETCLGSCVNESKLMSLNI